MHVVSYLLVLSTVQFITIRYNVIALSRSYLYTFKRGHILHNNSFGKPQVAGCLLSIEVNGRIVRIF